MQAVAHYLSLLVCGVAVRYCMSAALYAQAIVCLAIESPSAATLPASNHLLYA